MKALVVIALVCCFLGALMQAIVSHEPFKTSKNHENDEGESDSSDETGGEGGLADKAEENFDKTVEVVENMVDDPER